MRRLATYVFLFALVAVPVSLGAALSVPRTWRAPHQWLLGATCIHNHEGAWNDNTGNNYYGGMQFLASTWMRAGGPDEDAFHHPGDQTHHPFTPTPREQLYWAYQLWLRDHHSWSEWGTAGNCGLR